MKNTVVFLFLLISGVVLGQEANRLSGKLTDVRGNAVEGASVHILNTNFGANTDGDGKFELQGISAGRYKIEIAALGFASKRIDVEIKAGGANELSVELADAYTQLDAVVVTAQKQEESLQDIPSSVSAISSREIQHYRLWNTQSITAIVPNLYSSNSGDGRNVTSIRGITSTSYDPAVATYIDGVNQFGLDTYIAQLFDVERIEVLRGPQGTLYGRNAMGGVINIITRQPTNTTNGFAEASFGNYGQQRYGFGFRTPLVSNKLFFGASAVYDQMDGFYTNSFDNSSFDKKHSLTGNYYLRYNATDRWAITLNVKHNANRNNGTFPLAGTVEDAFNNPFTVNQNAKATMVDNVFNSSLSVNYAGNKINFTSQTTYQSNYRYYKTPIDGDFAPIDGVSIINNYGKDWNNTKVFTQEFKLTSPANTVSPLRWTAGTYLYRQESPVKQATRFGEDAAYVGADDTNFSIINTTTSKNSGIAFFGQATYKVSEKIEFTAGLRYDYEQKKSNVRGEYQHDPEPDPIFDIRPDTAATVSYSAISPKATLAWHIDASHQVYATYTRGFRTGGLTPFSSDPSQPPLYAFKPEYSNNFEVGLKNTFAENKVKVNVSVFYTEVTDAQVPTLVLPDAFTITRNAGTLRSKGVELEFAATPVKGLQLEFNGGITDATYQTLLLSQYGTEVDLKGKHQIFTPASTSMLAAQYQFAVGQDLKLIVRGEWMHLGEQYFDLGNNIRQKPFSLLNTRFGAVYRNTEIMFWGRNLGDEKYIAYAYDFGATHLGNPRTYGVTLRQSF